MWSILEAFIDLLIKQASDDYFNLDQTWHRGKETFGHLYSDAYIIFAHNIIMGKRRSKDEGKVKPIFSTACSKKEEDEEEVINRIQTIFESNVWMVKARCAKIIKRQIFCRQCSSHARMFNIVKSKKQTRTSDVPAWPVLLQTL